MKLFKKLAIAAIGAVMALGVGIGVNAGAKGVPARAETQSITLDFSTGDIKSFNSGTVVDKIKYVYNKNGGSSDPTFTKASGEPQYSMKLYASNYLEISIDSTGSGDYSSFASVQISATSKNNTTQGAGQYFSNNMTSSALYTHTLKTASFTLGEEVEFSGTSTTKIYIKCSSGQYRIGKIMLSLNKASTTPSTDPSVSIDDDSRNLTLFVGDTATLTATTENTEAVVVWSSSNQSVATINASTGALSAVGFGETTITATITDGNNNYSDSTKVTVLYPEPEIVENASLADILADTSGNGKKKFTTSGIIKQWGSKPAEPASEKDKYGNMIITDGTTDLIVYGSGAYNSTTYSLDWNGKEGVYTFVNGQNFKDLALTKNLKIGDRVYLTVTRCDYSKDGNVTKEVNGLITSTEIDELDSITVTPTKTDYYTGDVISSSDFTVIGTYTVSGDKEIASSACTISPSGQLLTEGTQTVTITYSGKSDTYEINVEKFVVNITSISIQESTLTLLSTDNTYQLNYEVLPANKTEGISFISSNETVATVSDTGLVTYVSEGSATITLKGENQVYEDSVSITCRRGASCGGSVTDVITIGTTGVTSGSYTIFSGKTASSDAVYGGKVIKNTQKNSNGCIQINNNSGALWTTGSGGLALSVKADFADTNGRNFIIYGSDKPYSSIGASGTEIGKLTSNGTVSFTTDKQYPYLYFHASGAMYVNSIEVVWDSKTFATVNDLDTLDEFMTDLLLMEEYDPELTGNGEGYCIDFWSDVKAYYNTTLTADQRAFFVNISVNTQYANAYARLVKWAEINGDVINTDNTLVKQESRSMMNVASSDVVAVAMLITFLSLTTIGAYFFVRKKKLG